MKSAVYTLFQKLVSLRKQLKSLDIPAKYLTVSQDKKYLHITEFGRKSTVLHKNLPKERNIRTMFFSWIEKKEITENCKFIAAEFIGGQSFHSLISDLWLTLDIVPYFSQEASSDTITNRFSKDNAVKVNLSSQNEVNVSELVTLADYKNNTSPEEFSLLQDLAKKFTGKKIVFIGATPQGGGVALMRHALIRLYNLLEVNAHWYVLYPQKDAFDITKTKFHNVLQAVASEDTVLTKEDTAVYNAWIAENAKQLEPAYTDADIVVIDDPQPSGLTPYIRHKNSKCKILYRSHIQIESQLANKKGTPQSITWNFIWNSIKIADLFISHPIPAFIPKNVPKEKTVMMPPTTDALDGLNKILSPRQTNYYLKLFDKILIESDQKPLERTRPYIIQVCRFDPSKGIPDVIESYRTLLEKLTHTDVVPPQLVIVGHASIDDPDSVPVFHVIADMLKENKYAAIRDDIKIGVLPPVDQLLNVLLREAKVALQLSIKEGFEVKVSEALMKGVPVVAYRTGGIPLQIKNNVSGYLIDTENIQAVAEKLYQLFTNDALYDKMQKAAFEHVNPETTTVSNAINWLFLATELLRNGKISGNGKSVKELLYKEY